MSCLNWPGHREFLPKGTPSPGKAAKGGKRPHAETALHPQNSGIAAIGDRRAY
jgi:hypothetical protein